MMKLPDSIQPAELEAMRRLQRELTADGYNVLEISSAKMTYTHGTFGPVALVADAPEGERPLRTFLAGCRSLLAVADLVDAGFKVTPEEYETIHSALLTLEVASRECGVDRNGTVGGTARERLGRAAGVEAS